MDLYGYLNFVAFIFYFGAFTFLFLLIVWLSYKTRYYRQLRRLVLDNPHFWYSNDAHRLVKKILKNPKKG